MGGQFQACESSRQGATATPTTIPLSSVRRSTSATWGSGQCPPFQSGGVTGNTRVRTNRWLPRVENPCAQHKHRLAE
jgi:hypothetical protein